MTNSLDLEYQLLAWSEFIEHQNLFPLVNLVVANSWKRCSGRQNPYKNEPPKRLSTGHFLSSKVAAFDLLSVARPVLEDIYQFIEKSESAVVLVNSAGYILDMLGDHVILDILKEYDIFPGTSLSESEVGTNAFGTSLIEGVPVSIVGAEHYQARYHELAEAAAPIFNPFGKPLGAFGIISPIHQYHPHTLGLAVAGARAVEGQSQSDQLLVEQNSQLTQIKTILATISDGIAVLDADRNLIHINPVAEKVLGIPAHVMLGRSIREFLLYPEFIRHAIDERKPLTDSEITFIAGDRSINCIVSIRYVQSQDDLLWIVCTLREETDVRKLVHSQVGAFASLTLDDLPGESDEIHRVHQYAKAAAISKTSTMIRGEAGTGKNPLARAIHNMSDHRDGPFMIFPSSSYPGELAVVELLGVEEGASSAVPGGRPSKFELANHGTLYFQDVHTLPLEAQGILLNVIDLGIAQRFGSKRSVPVDVRIIASTSANLEQLISQGSFRSSLYYRFRANEIMMPPLRERIADMPVLVDRIVERLSRQLKNFIVIDPEVIELLSGYDWPGNVRELEAVIGRAAMQGGYSGIITPGNLPDYILHAGELSEIDGAKGQIRPFDDLEREAILHAAEICEGNASEMARLLEVGRTTLWRRLKKLDISLDEYRDIREYTP